MQIKARLLLQRHPHPSTRQLRVEGGQMIDDYIKVAPCLFCPQGSPDILGYHSVRSHFFGIGGKREISLPVHPRLLLSAALQDTSCSWQGFIPRLSDLNTKLCPRFGSSCQEIFFGRNRRRHALFYGHNPVLVARGEMARRGSYSHKRHLQSQYG